MNQSSNSNIGFIKRNQAQLTSIGSIVAIFVLWEALVVVFKLPTYLLPKPSEIFISIFYNWQSFLYHSLVTGGETLGGFLLSIIVAIPLGALIVSSFFLEKLLYPPIIVTQAVPKVAIAPLLLIWLGFGITSKVAVAFLVAFFPLVVNTVVGLRSPSSEVIMMVRSLGATRNQTFIKIRFPAALPNIFAGLKVAITLAVIGAIVAEFVGSDSGLGYLMLVSQGVMDTTKMFGAVIAVSVMAILLFQLLNVLERIALPWYTREEA